MTDADRRTDGEVLEKTRKASKTPELWRVILHNDDYTTMEFVLDVLESVFQKSPAEAHRIMMHVHTRGSAVCGTYPFEVAETKVGLVQDRAKECGYPLKSSMEQA